MGSAVGTRRFIAIMTVGTVLYAKQERTYILKFVGDIRYTMSCSLDQFLGQLFKRSDYDAITIDLTETTSIDSTNLGLLAKVANFTRQRFGHKPPLYSNNCDINRVLDSMGLEDVFELHCEPCERCPHTAKPLEVTEPNSRDMARTILDAHCVLSELNEKNQIEFRDIVGVLRQQQPSISN